ncbi:hypothetical protein SDC9_166258 [bioreactor metagenome]|uniref:Uncharacterized protein n=1 Tax=bioreactor metagenome TaxID=1076179 RepID=A0A645G4E2_9ZZZZ
MRSLPRPLSEFSSSAIWMESSRVGARTNACGRVSPGSHSSMIGMPNAAVLPVPVWACPIRSFSPERSFGMVSSWIGDGVSNPFARNASRIGSEIPRLRKFSRSLIKYLSCRLLLLDNLYAYGENALWRVRSSNSVVSPAPPEIGR